ncbi:hypothetical protein LPJ61_001108 [Coemansia biformis]|uniref:Uncharacterized protein n=1 Tax=Coemansia biformis TaxID=1286918 RepID=A0A9W7YGL6_9FUNG|nr:hypothetical protein LPJ61_001108 [Coemansia biformis]
MSITPYRVVQWKSTTFKVLHTIYGAIDKAMPFFLATAGSVAVLVACAAHGAYTVLTVYGPADGRRVLDAIGGADHSKWMWLPAVPLALVWSRFQIGALYLPLSTLLMTAPQPLRIQWPMPPSLAMAALPTISALYRYVWTHTLGRLERRWESFLPPEQGTLTVHGFGFRHGAGANAGDGETNGNGWPMAAGGQAGTGAADNAPLQQPQQQEQRLGLPIRAGPNFEATIVLNGASLGRTLIESLLLPAISSALGSVIGRLPFARRAGLGTFSRAMLGGCAYFVVKDLIRTLYKYLLYRSCSSRHIEGRKRL